MLYKIWYQTSKSWEMQQMKILDNQVKLRNAVMRNFK